MWILYTIDPNLLNKDLKKYYGTIGQDISYGSEKPPDIPGTAYKEITRTENQIWDKSLLAFIDRSPQNEYLVEDFLNEFFSEAQIRSFLTSDDSIIVNIVSKLKNYKTFERHLKRDSAILNTLLNILVTEGIIDQSTKNRIVL